MVYTACLEKLSEWPEAVTLASRHFGLFLACQGDAEAATDVKMFARQALAQGLVTASIWGPGCERVHDLIDEVIVSDGKTEDASSVILTTWHAKESLEDALQFFVEILDPADQYSYSYGSLVIVSVGDSSYGKRVRDFLAHSHDKDDSSPPT